jgi:1-acyl-sn-glycerol-3-phosphate acyltransferase
MTINGIHPLANMIAAAARIISGVVVQWAGCNPDARQRIYFANHTSHLDFVVLWACLPIEVRSHTRPVAALDYWEASRLRRWLAKDVFRAILVCRNHPPSATQAAKEELARATLERIVHGMGDANSLIMFPEGTRGSGEEITSFKSGLYYLALRKPVAQVVPVHLENLNRILPKGEFLPVPFISRVTFGSPLELQNGEPKSEFLVRARNAICSLKDR